MAEIVQAATWPQIMECLKHTDLQIGLAGPPGVGKTHACFMVAASLGKIARKVQSHSELSPAEALGMYVPKKESFEWILGPIDECYSAGGMLILDELVEASGPLKTFLYGALDRGPGGTISYVGRTFVQQPGYQAVATMNGWPDQGGLPEALLDRFDAWFIVTEPTEGQYAMLDRDLREICRDCYATAKDPMVGPPITFRMLLGVQKMRKLTSLPLEQVVLAACYGNKVIGTSLLEVLQLSDPEDEEDEGLATGAADESEDDLWGEDIEDEDDDA